MDALERGALALTHIAYLIIAFFVIRVIIKFRRDIEKINKEIGGN